MPLPASKCWNIAAFTSGGEFGRRLYIFSGIVVVSLFVAHVEAAAKVATVNHHPALRAPIASAKQCAGSGASALMAQLAATGEVFAR
jgi:hypothetical protein